MTINSVSAVLRLVIFIVWLLAFPMKGFLLANVGLENAILFFIIPHAASLFATSYLSGSRLFPVIANTAIGVTIAGTALFPVAGKQALPLLAVIGVAAAGLLVKVMGGLRGAGNPALVGAASLAGGNLALLALMKLPWPPPAVHLVLALLLLVPLFCATPCCGSEEGNPVAWYLPFLFVYHLVSGLMYGTLMDVYGRYAFVDGIELLFYVGTAFIGAYLARKGKNVLLVLGIICGMLTFSLFQVGGAAAVNLSMFGMQASEGFVDLFVLVLLLSRTDCLRAAGPVFGSVCAGIAGGHVISGVAGGAAGLIVGAANLILTGAVFIFVFFVRKQEQEAEREAERGVRPALVDNAAPSPGNILLSPALQKRFSQRERAVLDSVIRGKTFRETAEVLSLSESSVKTYMKRIYEKMGVTGKEGLLTVLGNDGGTGGKEVRVTPKAT